VIELFQDAAGEWRFTVKGRNGEIIVTSEGYTRRRDAKRGLHTLRRRLLEGIDVVEVIQSEKPKPLPTWNDLFGSTAS
jgi:hypothetical protein